MDKERIVKIARDSGVPLNRQEDGSYLLFNATKLFADRIESAVSHKYETERKKDQQDLIALRQKVQNLAGENIKLRAAIGNARECLNLAEEDNDDN